MNQIIHGDSLEYMKTLPDKSIDLVLTDPPYFGVVKNDWDNQWKTRDDFINWLEEYTIEWKRILKDNGSLYIFGDDKIIAYVQVMMDKYFKLENSIIWNKGKGYLTSKGWDCSRSYAPVTERLLFYSNEILKTGLQEIHDNPNLFTSIRDYMREQKRLSGLSAKGLQNLGLPCNLKLIGMYFGNIQWQLPTESNYRILQKSGYFKKEYEELRKEYEELRKEYEELRRPFTPAENFTDVWTFSITSEKEKWAGKHPTIKPLQVIKRIIETSSKPGDLILDCFAGSGTTAVACIETGRNYIVIEKEADYVEIIKKRVKNTTPPLFVI